MTYYADVPAPSGATLAPQGTTAPPSGMRKVTFESPFGRQTAYVPMSMSPEDAYAAIQQRIMPQLAQQHFERSKKAALENAASNDVQVYVPLLGGNITVPGRYVTAAGHGFNDLIQGVKQWITGGSPAQDTAQAEGERAMAPLYAAAPSAKAARVFGTAAPLAAASLALTPAAAVATPAASLGNAAVQGAISAALPYVPPGGSRSANALSGFATGAAVQSPFSALQKIAMGPTTSLTIPELAAVRDAQAIPGVNPLPSQLTGNPALSNAERVMGYFPFSSGKIAARTAGNQTAANAEILRILGAPEGTQYGTQSILAAMKKSATDVMDQVANSGAPVIISADKAASLDAIRTQALNANTPNTALAKTIDKLIGRRGEIDPNTVVGGRTFGSLPPAQQATLGPQLAATGAVPPLHPEGIPPDFFKSVQSDLSRWSADKDYLAGQANKVLTEAAVESLPGELGVRLVDARQRYGALMTADSAFDPTTGNVNLGTLARNLSTGGPDVMRYGESSNPRLLEMADVATAGRGMPAPPAMGSPTAANLTMQKLMGLVMEGGAGAGAALGLHTASGGGMTPEALGAGALGALIPFLAANYGTKAYLSPAIAKYVQEGIPSLAEIMERFAPLGGSALPAAAGAYSSQP